MSSEEDEEESDLSVEDEVDAPLSESEEDEADASSSESEDEEEFDEERFERTRERIAANDPYLTRVNFDNQDIGDERAGRLAVALRVNTVIRYLSLRNAGISEALVSALVDAVANSTTLIELNLSGNNTGLEGARALVGFLLHNSSLNALCLNNCGIGVEVVRLLAGGITSNSSLTYLGLGGNNCGDEGASVLAGALPGNSTLTQLNLAENGISIIGARALAEALPSNTSLAELWLMGNSITDVGARRFAKVLLAKCTVAKIYFEGNDISEDLKQLVEDLARINANATKPQEALGLKIEWLINLDEGGEQLLGFEERGAKEKAVSLALDNLDSFVETEQRQQLFGRLLGSPEHGENVANTVEIATARTLYRYAAGCGAAPTVLMNLLRAHESLCTCRDVQHKLYPFMLLAAMSEAGVGDVMEALQKDPTLVKSGIDVSGDDKNKGHKRKYDALQGVHAILQGKYEALVREHEALQGKYDAILQSRQD